MTKANKYFLKFYNYNKEKVAALNISFDDLYQIWSDGHVVGEHYKTWEKKQGDEKKNFYINVYDINTGLNRSQE